MKQRVPVFPSIVAGLIMTIAFGIAIRAELKSYEPAPTGNNVTFHAHSTGHDFDGKTAQVTGSFGCDRTKIAATAFGSFKIPVKSLKTGITARDNEMYSLFEAERFPNIAFQLKRLSDLRQAGSDTYTAKAVGELTIHGIAREESLAVNVTFIDDKMFVNGTAAVKISDYGMEPPHFLFFKVADGVRISFKVDGRIRV